MEDYITALQDLRGAVQDLRRQSMDTRDAVASVINNSHLKSALGLLKEDIGFRRLLELMN